MSAARALILGLGLGGIALLLTRQARAAEATGAGEWAEPVLDPTWEPGPDAQPDAAPAVEEGAGLLEQLWDTFLPVSWSMDDQNLQAFLRMIREAEGTADDNGYRRLFGGSHFDSFADHPRTPITARLGGRPITSTAAGAYQILEGTWDEVQRRLKLPDFSPASQDRAAVELIRRRGALADVLAGRLDAAVKKTAREWASLPGSPYGQPTISWDKARRLYLSYGGRITGGTVYA